MQLNIVAFAHAKQIFGFAVCTSHCEPGETPRGILLRLAPLADFRGLAVAVDGEYVALDSPIGEARELAIIPPVSGG